MPDAPGIVVDSEGRVTHVRACRWTVEDQKRRIRAWRQLHWVCLALSVGMLIALVGWGPAPVARGGVTAGNLILVVVVFGGLWAWLYLPSRTWVAALSLVLVLPVLWWAVRQGHGMWVVDPSHPAVRGFLSFLLAGILLLLTSGGAGIARRGLSRQRRLFEAMERWSGMARDARARGLQVAYVQEAISERRGKSTRVLLRQLNGINRSGTLWRIVEVDSWVAVDSARTAVWQIPRADAQAWATLDARGARRHRV